MTQGGGKWLAEVSCDIFPNFLTIFVYFRRKKPSFLENQNVTSHRGGRVAGGSTQVSPKFKGHMGEGDLNNLSQII